MSIIESRHVESNFVLLVCLFSPLYIFFSPLFFFIFFFFSLYTSTFSYVSFNFFFLTFHLMQQVLRLNIRLDFTQLVKWIYFSLSPFLSSFFFFSVETIFFLFLDFHSNSCSDFHFYFLGILPFFTPYCYILQFFNTWMPSWVKHS